jgi:hypothetical protein
MAVTLSERSSGDMMFPCDEADVENPSQADALALVLRYLGDGRRGYPHPALCRWIEASASDMRVAQR